ncbi:hypothetical protein TSUD_141030 [Trifolium subterraneum]|uniref:Transposase-associated domain-containing protein n=1 Tax=Trifolium subterraneum TaxID=3900 RepID=A0A2Z6P5N9_TRISU|nr:hypothetical protein TSUD_141030 [Trifolium subterraneum]
MYDRCYDGGQVKEVFKLGVELFIDAVKRNPVVLRAGGIRCPCASSKCRRFHSEEDIKVHLRKKGFQPNYWIWTSHGETFPSDQGASSSARPVQRHERNDHGRYPFNNMNEMIGDALGFHEANKDEYEAEEPPNAEAQRFYNLLKDYNESLLIEELAMDQIAKLVLDTTPISARGYLPQSFYEAKQLVAKLGLGVKRIDCCINGCMLFYNNEFGVSDGDLVECKLCQEPRYEIEDDSNEAPHDEDQPLLLTNLSRNKVTPRDLIPKVVYNSRLYPMPMTGESSTRVGDDEAHEDEVIRPEDLQDLEKYFLVAGTADLQPHKAATSAITDIIQGIPQIMSKCTWLEEHTCQVMKNFDHKCSKRLSDMLRLARSAWIANKDPPKWIGTGDIWDELKIKWNDPDYVKVCEKNKANRAVQPNASKHSGGSTFSSILRIRFTRKFRRPPTLDQMNVILHQKENGEWDSVRAERANKLKADEASLPPAQRKSVDVIHNMILDKFVEFSGGKHHGHVHGQGCTSSFIQRTPGGYMNISNASRISSGQSVSRESIAEMEQRLRAEHQEEMAKLREEFQLQRQQHQIGGNGPNEINVNRGGRTSAGSASGGRTSGGRVSAGRTARGRGGNALN